MAEVVWVLDRAYGLTDQKIAATIERILQVDVLVVENEQEVFAEAGTRRVCRCLDRRARCTSRLHLHPHI